MKTNNKAEDKYLFIGIQRTRTKKPEVVWPADQFLPIKYLFQSIGIRSGYLALFGFLKKSLRLHIFCKCQ